MQNPFKMLGDLKKMQEQAKEIQADLEKEIFTTQSGRITVKITGNQRIIEVLIDGTNVPELVDVLNDAIKQSQQAAASKLAQISQSMGLGQ